MRCALSYRVSTDEQDLTRQPDELRDFVERMK